MGYQDFFSIFAKFGSKSSMPWPSFPYDHLSKISFDMSVSVCCLYDDFEGIY